ncbi:universal stress protein [Salinirubrum litoreum]|uniref:Universal stress protein n=1 Tax=Salinirubrum litoreum TaxID=1126234 RepID=A0ABD5RFV6_9EURY|nr:universal stress protein [Salinirubrum litoreum]
MHLVVAVDGSPEAEEALAHATDIADATDARITAVHAVDPSVPSGDADPFGGATERDRQLIVESVETAEERGLEILDAIEDVAGNLGYEIETELVYGDPADAITDYAETVDADAIYVGHRGLSERRETMVGSVAKQFVERADRPVTVVR